MENNKLLIIINKDEELELISSSLESYKFIEYLSIDKVIESDFEILNDYKIVLDTNIKLFNFLKEKKLLIQKLDNKYNYIEYENVKIFECPNLFFLFNRSNHRNFTDEHKKEVNYVISRFYHLLALLENQFFKETKKEKKSFTDLIVENKEKKIFKLVETIPEEKEEGINYLTLDTMKELNNIFEIINSVV